MKMPNDANSTNIRNGKFFHSYFHQLSHELRTPINHINGFAELLLMDKDLSAKNVEYVSAIISGSENLKAAVKFHLDCAEAIVAPPKTERAPHESFGVGAIDPTSNALVGIATVPVSVAGERPSTTAKSRPESVIGPLGQPMTLASLPPVDTKRWVAHRKAELVSAVHGGLLTIEEVCERYGIEPEEFDAWQRSVERLGLRGLWAARSQKHRDLAKRRQRLARKKACQDKELSMDMSSAGSSTTVAFLDEV